MNCSEQWKDENGNIVDLQGYIKWLETQFEISQEQGKLLCVKIDELLSKYEDLQWKGAKQIEEKDEEIKRLSADNIRLRKEIVESDKRDLAIANEQLKIELSEKDEE